MGLSASSSGNGGPALIPSPRAPKFEPALNAPSLSSEPSLNDFEQQAWPIYSGLWGHRTSHLLAWTASMPVLSVLGTGQCLSPAALLPPIRLPRENCPAMMSGTFRAPTIPMIISSVRRESPRKLPRPELDLQRTNATRLDCLHDTNLAAPAALTTYKSKDTPPLASATTKS